MSPRLTQPSLHQRPVPRTSYHPVDPKGLVVDFRVRGRRYLFDGQSGQFFPELSGSAEQALDALRTPAAERRRTWARLCQADPDVGDFVDELEQYRLGTHPKLKPESPQRGFVHNGRPCTFTVYLSRVCNLACRYCFTRGGRQGDAKARMSLDTARATLQFIRGIAEQRIHPVIAVNLFGGEPLMNPDAAYLLARGLQDLNKRRLKTKIHILLTTNGTIEDERVFRVLAEKPPYGAVVVSLDAVKADHNRNRPFANGPRASFGRVLATIQRLRRDRIPYSVTCVVPHPHRFVRAARSLEALGIQRYEIKQLLQHQFGRQRLPAVFQRNFDVWRQGYLAYTDMDLETPGPELGVTRVDRTLLFSRYAEAFDGDPAHPVTLACGVADRKVGIETDGSILPCESYAGENLGTVQSGFDRKRYVAFERRMIHQGQWRIRHPACRRCFAKRLCGGGCYAQSQDRYGRLTPSALWQGSCEILRETVKIDLYYIAEMRRLHPRLFRQLAGVS